MTVEQLQETIKDYLDGTMSGTEKTDFEAQIKSDADLAEEVRRFRQLSILNKNKPLLDAKATLSAVMAETTIEPDYGDHEKYFKKSLFENPLWRWLVGGLAVVLLVGGGIVYQKIVEAEALKNLSIKNLAPYTNIINFAPDDQTQAAKAMRAYDNKNYAEASSLLNFAVKNDPTDNSLKLYLANCYLMQKQNSQAETLLKDMIRTNDLSQNPAKWYLALTLMQRGEKEEARVLLQSLENDSFYGVKAKEVLSAW
jgi:tetratricopeptide (TPR) repeat protein